MRYGVGPSWILPMYVIDDRVEPDPEPVVRPARPNRFPGRCALCNTWVPEGGGTLHGGPGGWKVHCPDAPDCRRDGEPAGPPVMTNRFRSRCERCGLKVEAGEGRLERSPLYGWLVFHWDRCPDEVDGVDLSNVPPGRYMVDDRRYLITVVNKGAKEGWILVKEGSEYSRRRATFGHQRPGARYLGQRTEDMEVIAANPHGAASRYARKTGRCWRCGRTLEDPESVRRGVGPECVKHI